MLPLFNQYKSLYVVETFSNIFLTCLQFRHFFLARSSLLITIRSWCWPYHKTPAMIKYYNFWTFLENRNEIKLKEIMQYVSWYLFLNTTFSKFSFNLKPFFEHSQDSKSRSSRGCVRFPTCWLKVHQKFDSCKPKFDKIWQKLFRSKVLPTKFDI